MPDEVREPWRAWLPARELPARDWQPANRWSQDRWRGQVELSEPDDVYPSDDPGCRRGSYQYPVHWRTALAKPRQTQLRFEEWPEVMRGRLAGLCHPVFEFSRQRFPPPADLRSADRGNGVDPVCRVAADPADIQRWDDAGYAYLTLIREALDEIGVHWQHDRPPRHLPGLRPRARQRWKDLLIGHGEQLLAASERYQVVLSEIRSAAEATQGAYQELTSSLRIVDEWQVRTPWCLVPSAGQESLLIRADLLEQRPAIGRATADPTAHRTVTGGLHEVHQAAAELRSRHLRRTTWDQEWVVRCDRELAELGAEIPAGPREPAGPRRPVGRTLSGAPMLELVPATLTSFCRLVVGVGIDWLASRQILRHLRELREYERKHPPGRFRAGGSWPTSYGAGGF